MGTLVPSCKGWKRLTAAVCAGLMAGAFSFLPVAEALRGGELPQGGISSTASITTNDGTMNITGAENNVIKWVSFSIGEGNAVKFDNNDYLNYVTGHARSDIMGTLTGGGNIYLVNPNGILIGDSARIDVGNLYLSTRNLTTDQLTDYATATGALFSAGDLKGDVINMGKLNADVISVEGNNITFKNVADVTKGGTLANGDITGGTLNSAVTLTANGGEIHLGYENGEMAMAVNDTQYRTVNTPTLSGWNFGGKTPAYYMLVRNEYELQNMQNNLSGNYMLANDIDMSGVTFAPIGNGKYDYYGDEDKNYFKGNFNGLNHEIRNLCIDSTEDCVGLFGVNSGTIRNVGLVGGSITGYAYVGSIAGQNTEGTIENVFNTGTVKSINSDNGRVGGIVGSNILGTIKNAYNTGAVTSTSWGGGIVAMNEGGTIENVFNTGAIAGVGTSNWLGGIVGQNNFGQIHDEPQYGGSPDIDPHMNQQVVNGTITNAYNTGTVTSNSTSHSWVGGIAGQNNVYHALPAPGEPPQIPDESSGSSNIMNVYNTGTVSGTGEWVFQDGIVDDEGVSNAYTSEDGDLKKAATFQGFDFSENGAWRIYEGQTMPLLTAFLKRADYSKGTAVYNGTSTGDVGANYSNSTYSGTVNQIGGINYVKDYTIVTPKELTVTGGVDKTYDGTTDATLTAANLEGVVTGDALTVDVTSAAYDNKNVGTGKTVTYGGLTISGAKAKNYTIGASGTTTGAITRKALELVADPVTITQGQEIPASFTGNLTGFVAGEGLTEGDAYAFALEGTPDAVGSYAVNGTLNGNASGDYGANYTFANAASNATAFTINAKPAPSNPGSGSGGSVTPATPVNPVEPAPINPAEPIPANPAGPTPAIPSEPTPATPGTPGQAVTNPASGTLRPEGTLAEWVIAEVEAGNLSLGTVTELENAAETAKEQAFAKDRATMAEMGAVEANAPSPAPSDSGHSYTMLDGGLVAVRDDVNSAPASAVMGSNPGRRNANEVMEAAEQVDLTIGTEEVHNRQENSTVDEDSDEEDKKQSEQN
ncbi:MAG: filamentous hemagglutinin N-terminal domain-containing protein [Selenomonas ruminantium]|nr:filamentous hemagglutinin N-terminal domain-containing protein [Selenomonas ruminantium]